MQYKVITDGGVTSAQGFVAGVCQAGIKKADRYDLTIIYSTSLAQAAGVFTTNKFQAAPVLLSKKHLVHKTGRALVINSGCANACTGETGFNDAFCMAEKTAEVLGLTPQEVFVASTGVIGVFLPMEKIKKGIKEAGESLSQDKGYLAAKAIMTTDTYPKELALEVEIGGKKVTIGAMAKGSGMIHPQMATMLGFITTDVNITAECLQKALSQANQNSFNMVTVDGDTSTNDMVIILANNLADNLLIDKEGSKEYNVFLDALTTVCTRLAQMIAEDGEGATKLMEVQVVNAVSEDDARKAAKSIAGSSLVKAALFGEDANWGRIICALGYSTAEFNPDTVDVYLGNLKVAKNGTGLIFDEVAAKKILAEKKVVIRVDLQQGVCQATAWGCDLSYDYVKINADYRT